MLNKAVDLDTFGLKWNWIEWSGKPIFATIFATASQIFATSVPLKKFVKVVFDRKGSVAKTGYGKQY